MKKSDYLLKKDRAEHPYYYWIIGHESEITSECRLSEEYLVFMQSTGSLEKNALSYIQENIKDNPDLIYTDEDILSEGTEEEKRRRNSPWFKPDWSPDTLDSFFYMGGLVIVKRAIAKQVSQETGIEYESLRGEDGIYHIDSSYFEYLRECAKKSKNIVHVPRILFHNHKKMQYEYVTPRYVGEAVEKISVVILSKDNPDMLQQAVRAVEIGGQGQEIEMIVVDNGSSPENKEKVTQLSGEHGFQYLYHPMAFEYSTLCNIGAKAASGDYLLFLNDDVELVGPIRFLSRMVWEAKKPHVGAVGMKLLYPGGDKIQHVGITDLAVGPSHKLATYSDAIDYDHGRNHMTYNCLAVTGACLMVAKEKFLQVGGFDEHLAVAYTDVDLCVDLYEQGYYNLVINECFLYHHESVSRGNDVMEAEKLKRLQKEQAFFYQKHPFIKEKGDPFYHKDLTKYKLSYEPEFQQEWECTDQLAVPEWKTGGKCRKTEKEHFHSSIDDVRFIPAAEDGTSGFVEIEGWVFWKKKDNLKYDKSLLLTDKNEKEKILEVSVVSKYRSDLADVFPGEKNILFSGFICRIPTEEYQKYTGMMLAPALTKNAGAGCGTCFYKETTWQIGNERI